MPADQNEVESILKDLYPVQCEMVGEKLVAYVSQGGTEFAPPSKGKKNDYLEILKSLASVVGFITALINLRTQRQNALIKNLKDEIARLKAAHSELTEKEQEKIEERVLKP